MTKVGEKGVCVHDCAYGSLNLKSKMGESLMLFLTRLCNS